MSRLKQPEVPFVIVVWDDAHGYDDETIPEDVKHAPRRCISVGWLMKSDEKGVSIAGEWSPTEHNYRTHTFIFRPMVIEEIVAQFSRKHNGKKKTPPVEAKEAGQT